MTCALVKTTNEQHSFVMQRINTRRVAKYTHSTYIQRKTERHFRKNGSLRSVKTLVTAYAMETDTLGHLQLLNDCACVLMRFRLPSQVAGQILEASAHRLSKSPAVASPFLLLEYQR